MFGGWYVTILGVCEFWVEGNGLLHLLPRLEFAGFAGMILGFGVCVRRVWLCFDVLLVLILT